MKNYIQPGDVLELTAPSGGVVSGNADFTGGLLLGQPGGWRIDWHD